MTDWVRLKSLSLIIELHLSCLIPSAESVAVTQRLDTENAPPFDMPMK